MLLLELVISSGIFFPLLKLLLLQIILLSAFSPLLGFTSFHHSYRQNFFISLYRTIRLLTPLICSSRREQNHKTLVRNCLLQLELCHLQPQDLRTATDNCKSLSSFIILGQAMWWLLRLVSVCLACKIKPRVSQYFLRMQGMKHKTIFRS